MHFIGNSFLSKCYNIFWCLLFYKIIFYHILTITKIFVWWGGVCPYVVPVCVRLCVCMCCQTEQQMGTAVASQMADPNREDEQVTLLGEEGLRAGGQALKLGYSYIIFFSFVVLVLNCYMLYYSIQCNLWDFKYNMI